MTGRDDKSLEELLGDTLAHHARQRLNPDDESYERALESEQRRKQVEAELEGARARGAQLEQNLAQALSQLEAMQREIDQLRSQEVPSGSPPVKDLEALLREARSQARSAQDWAWQFESRLREASKKIEELSSAVGEWNQESRRLDLEDPLTGLPNLKLMRQYVDFLIRQVQRYERPGALLLMDLDGFQLVNDALGFQAGDELLVRVAERLQSILRDSDVLARRGEDEFLLLLSELNLEAGAPADRVRSLVEIVARRVLAAITHPFEIQSQKFYITASIGVSICPLDAGTTDEVLEHADTALNRAKERGRGRFHFYTADLQQRQKARLSLENEIRLALQANQFLLLYQPILELGSDGGRMVGVEALLRWRHPARGLLGPEHFLHAAEETGLILPVGDWVFDEVSRQMQRWLRSGLELFAAINLSARQLRHGQVARALLSSLTAANVPPGLIIVDVAEGLNALNAELIAGVSVELGKAGVRIAIDDFGTGLSSLKQLHLGPTNILKIAHSLLAGCPEDPDSSRVLLGVIGLAQALGVLPLAKGVERRAQARFLAQNRCRLAQGYYFSGPVEADLVTSFADMRKTWSL
ncbi:MAG: EAL domain-containing protein [Armatimonadetes bacterium]|nr:EAL domain-containing protein [Armatimonadota bacterium]